MNENPPLGTATNPVLCDGVTGQRDYLNRLVTLDGTGVEYFRRGSYGGAADGHILDGFAIFSGEDDGKTYFFDLYRQDSVENRPIDGFRLKETGQAASTSNDNDLTKELRRGLAVDAYNKGVYIAFPGNSR